MPIEGTTRRIDKGTNTSTIRQALIYMPIEGTTRRIDKGASTSTIRQALIYMPVEGTTRRIDKVPVPLPLDKRLFTCL